MEMMETRHEFNQVLLVKFLDSSIDFVRNEDFFELMKMLKMEGLLDSEMDFYKHETWVMNRNKGIAGFFTLRHEHGIPYLSHFCVKRDARCHSLARRLVSAFKNVVRDKGFHRAIINVPCGNEYLKKLVSVYFKTTPYATNDGLEFFLVGV